MASLRRGDYERLFALGKRLYTENPGHSKVREVGVELMAMAEFVIGQQIWPSIERRYRHLTVHPDPIKGSNIIPLKRSN